MRGDLPPRTSELIFGNIENIHDHAAEQCVRGGIALLVIITGNNGRRIQGEFRDSLEHIFRRIGREVCDKLVIDSQIH